MTSVGLFCLLQNRFRYQIVKQQYMFITKNCYFFLQIHFRFYDHYILFYYRFESSKPGYVFHKERPDSEEKVFLLFKPRTESSTLPKVDPVPIPNPGLSEERRRYLFANIRQFCKPQFQDILCSEATTVPQCAHEVENVSEVEETEVESVPPTLTRSGRAHRAPQKFNI